MPTAEYHYSVSSLLPIICSYSTTRFPTSNATAPTGNHNVTSPSRPSTNDPSIAHTGSSAYKIAARTADYEDRFANPFIAAERGFIDDVIVPSNSRFRFIQALEKLSKKQLENPKKKFGNINCIKVKATSNDAGDITYYISPEYDFMIIDSFIELRNGKINKLSLVDEPKFLEE